MNSNRAPLSPPDPAGAEPTPAAAGPESLLAELNAIVESSPVGLASLRGLQLVHCNRRFEQMLGLPPGTAAQADLLQLLQRPGVLTRVGGAPDGPSLAQLLLQGEPLEIELQVLEPGSLLPTPDSHWYTLSIRRTGPAGAAPAAIVVLSEITRLKLQQAQLEDLAVERAQMAHVLGQQADRNRAVLDSVLVGIVTVEASGRVTWLNRSARRMFGGDLGDFLGLPLQAVASNDPQHPFRQCPRLFAELQDGEAVQFECQVCAQDGRIFWVVGSVVATVDASAERELTFALMDFEQRRQAESRVAHARASLQRIIEAAPMAITLFDARTLAVLQINRAAAEATGLAPERADAVVGRTLVELMGPAQASRLRADLLAALERPEGVTQRDYPMQQGSRQQIWDVRFLPLVEAEDPAPAGGTALPHIDRILMVATDVTAQRAAQRAELEAAVAQREMLVQEVHHRIKNNLQGVAGLLQQIGQRRPEVRAVMTEVVGQVQAIAQVYGLQVGGAASLQVRAVVEAIAGSVSRTFGRPITFQADEATHWVLPENESIPIALTLNELFTNAVKHSPPEAPVACRLRASAQGLVVEIDNLGRLPADFRVEHRPSAVSGLGLVRALLPRRHAALLIEQQGDHVRTQISLQAPVLRRAAPAAATPRVS